jgi:signal transduction histidine kinase
VPILDANGNLNGYRGIGRDITERKQAEEEKRKLEAQLQQAQRMEAIGTLAGGIAHDFNNILSLILGYTELSINDVPEGSRARDNLDKLYKAGERARDLVKQILTFSRQREQEQKPVEIHLIVKEVLKLLQSSLPRTIEIRQNIATTGTVLADPTQIHQVIMNLCTNAYHAMLDKGGVLELSVEEVELDTEFTARHLGTDPGPHLKLTVTDTGYGMDKQVLDRIFEPYYTTRKESGGTGIGLSVVHGIVKNHGGVITVYSEPGKGTTFNVFLPRIESPEGVAETEEVGALPRGNERILFVDDEPAIVDIGKGMLAHLGYRVETRTSSIEALEAFRAQPEKFDLVITDMTMPNMTGDELARELMVIRSDLPIIICTGFSGKISEEKAKAMGIRKLVMKPIVMSEMAKAVREALDK